MNCKNCGAPLTPDEEKCSYCGSYIERSPSEIAERKRIKQESIRHERLKALPEIKFVSIAFIVLANIFTLGFYAVYWYVSRRKIFDRLTNDYKFPDLGLVVHVIALILFYVSDNESIYSIALPVSWLSGIYMAFQVKNILRAYALKNIDLINSGSISITKLIAPSSILLILFGSIYLQSQINKMINLELFAPEV